MITNVLEAIGRTAIGALERCGRFAIFAMQTVSALAKRPNRKHITVQMERIGVNSLPIVLLTALFTGMVLSIQIAHEFIRYGAQSTIGGIVAIAMCRELAPVLTGVVVAGRVGASITAELGSMRVTEQIDALRVMGTNP
ncbi:MAG: ABC transporter permease, partial [Selenomonadales bacterium]|nr:ABC transporter permease [Selenomonadales bacterium]